jgi:hypothetical protein
MVSRIHVNAMPGLLAEAGHIVTVAVFADFYR